MVRMVLVALCALGLAGCGVQRAVWDNPTAHLYQAGAIWFGADVISLSSTGKTIDDHIIGLATHQDCSLLRASHGGEYCEPLPLPIATVAVTTYCYKSLASVSCYDRPLPFDQARYDGARVDQVPAP